jgi:hypothetical protein
VRGAESGLIALSLEEDDEPARDRECNSGAEIIFDERDDEIDALGEACRGPHALIVDEHGIRVHVDSRVPVCEVIAECPVGGGLAVVE